MRKRVLQFFGSFNQGGSERQAAALTRRLHDDGTYDVFAATLSKDGVLRPDVEAIGLPEIPEFPLTSFLNPNFVRQVRRCSAYLRENNIDLVHTHDFYTNVFGMAAARLAGVSARVASKRETAGMRTPPQDVIEKMAFGRAHAIVVNSKAVAQMLCDRGVPREKIETIYNGLNIDQFNVGADRKKLEERYSVSAKGNVITSVANLRHEVKNIPMLLRAAKGVLSDLPDTRFVVAGEGSLRAELEGQAVRLGIAANVHFIGRCDDIAALLAASDLCVLTSTTEGFSNSILEYMAARKPVVVTDVGGAAEAVENEVNGYLLNSNDDQSLADRLIELLNDPALAKKMGDAGRAVVEKRFSAEAQLKNTLDLYQRLLDR